MRLVVIGVGVIATLISLAGAFLMTQTVQPLFIGPGDEEPPGSESRPIVRLRLRPIEEPSSEGDGAM
jgi:hypothetical protein